MRDNSELTVLSATGPCHNILCKMMNHKTQLIHAASRLAGFPLLTLYRISEYE